MKNILIVINDSTEFAALHHLANAIDAGGRYQPLIYFSQNYPLAPKHIFAARQANLPVLAGPRMLQAMPQRHLFDNSGAEEPEIAPLTKQQVKTRQWLVDIGVDNLDQNVAVFQRETTWLDRLITKSEIALVIVGEENVSNFTTVATKVAQDRDVPSVIVPWGFASLDDFVKALSAIDLYDGESPAAQQFTGKYPHWGHAMPRPILRSPLADAAAMEVLSLSPSKPWVHNDGFADVIAAESERMVEHYAKQGLPDNKVRLIGAWSDDHLAAGLHEFDNKRELLCRSLQLDPGKPIILCALPPDMTRQRKDDIQFSNHDEILAFWIDALAAHDSVNVVLSAHPSLCRTKLHALEKPNIRFANQPTVELMPLCDFFVASVSSIIRWALACGVPVLDYDLYRFDYADYKDESAVTTVTSRADFRSRLNRFISGLTIGEHIPRDGTTRQSRWGRLDGKTMKRMFDLFDELTKNQPDSALTRPRRPSAFSLPILNGVKQSA